MKHIPTSEDDDEPPSSIEDFSTLESIVLSDGQNQDNQPKIMYLSHFSEDESEPEESDYLGAGIENISDTSQEDDEGLEDSEQRCTDYAEFFVLYVLGRISESDCFGGINQEIEEDYGLLMSAYLAYAARSKG